MAQAAYRSSAREGYRRGVLLILLGSTCSSSIGLAMRTMESADAWQILFYRSMGVALLVLIVLALRRPAGKTLYDRATGIAMLIGGLAMAGAFSGIIVALQQTTVANAMFLLAATPFMAALIGRLVLKERVRGATWIAIVTAFVGITVMVAEALSFGHLRGNVFGLLAALGFAVFSVALRWGRLGDMMPTTLIAAVIGMGLSAVLCQLTGIGVAISLHDTLLSLAMGVFQLGAALVLYTWGARTVPAAELTLLGMTEVVLAPFWVWLFLGETASVLTLVGGAILLAAIAGDALSGLRRNDAS